MPFNPHTPDDVREMLAVIGVNDTEQLFDEIPAALRIDALEAVPPMVSEMEISRVMLKRAVRDGITLNFIGAGAYEHHIPAAVWQIATRGEYYSAYTPYQAEASQGTLQLIYEYQTMMCELTGMEVSNASLYDGASAVAEAALMAVRANRKSTSRRLLVAGTLNPRYRQVVVNITKGQGLVLEELPCCMESGNIVPGSLQHFEGQDIAGLIIPQPNFFGVIEEVDALTDWAHANNSLVIGVVNPIAMAVLKAPGNWGTSGADIVCGEGQPLGVPLSGGGPYFGFMTCRQRFVRQMPGRLVGRTVDLDGNPGFALTLQAREQHIRRSRATSNICTNQGLMVTAATIHMAMLGAEGLRRVALSSCLRTRQLVEALTELDTIEAVFSGPNFHEAVLRLDRRVGPVLAALAHRGVFGGYDLSDHYPELGHALLVCATETKTESDIQTCADAFRAVMADARVA